MFNRPFVFLSHASLDKARLRPLIEALLKAGIKIWLDNPVDAGFRDDEVGQFLRIRAGARWEDEIDEALRESACVLVCWSKHASDPEVRIGNRKLTWMQEAGYGRTAQKLVACTIDEVDPQSLPGTQAAQQMPRVDPDLPEERVRAATATLIADVNQMIARWIDRRKSTMGFRDDLGPYLVDRRTQEQEVADAIAGVTPDGGLRPIVISGPSNELPDQFFTRVLRSCASLVPNVGGLETLDVEWPGRSVTPGMFADGYRRNLWRALGRAAAMDDHTIALALEQRGKPVVIYHCIATGEWESNEAQKIEAWFGWWKGLSQSYPRLKLLPWLQINMESCKPGWHDAPAGMGQIIWKAVRRLKDTIAADSGSIAAPPVLAPIMQGDAERWARTMALECGELRLHEEIEKLYPPSGPLAFFGPQPRKYGINHQAFAKAVLPLFSNSN